MIPYSNIWIPQGILASELLQRDSSPWRSFCADWCESMPIPYIGIPFSGGASGGGFLTEINAFLRESWSQSSSKGTPLPGGASERGVLMKVNDFLKESLPQSPSKGIHLSGGASERGFLIKIYGFLKESLPQSSSKGIPLPGGVRTHFNIIG